MRIGIDARMYGPSFTGIGRYTYELIRHLANLDTDNTYVIFLRKEAFDSFVPPSPRFTKVLADYPHYSFSEQFQFLRVLNRARLDLVHFCHFNAPIFYRRPYIVTIHDLTVSFYPGKKMNGFLRRLAYEWVLKSVTRKARKIIAVSQNTKDDLRQLLGIPDGKITVIYNGIDPAFAQPSVIPKSQLTEKFGLHKPYFLYTGVWRDHKNVVGLLQAFSLLQHEMNGSFQLLITGRPNSSYPEIPATIKVLGLQDDVCLSGLVSEEELKTLYQHALAYVFPSFYEGFGFPPLEAMQCGIPVAASSTSSIPEVCGEGNALFFDPHDTREMKEAMRLVATNSGIRNKLIERGLKHVRQFDWGTMAKMVMNIYNQCESQALPTGRQVSSARK